MTAPTSLLCAVPDCMTRIGLETVPPICSECTDDLRQSYFEPEYPTFHVGCKVCEPKVRVPQTIPYSSVLCGVACAEVLKQRTEGMDKVPGEPGYWSDNPVLQKRHQQLRRRKNNEHRG